MYKTFIAVDKWVNREILGDPYNRTVSRNYGSRIGRTMGTDTQTGTDIFHGLLLVAGVVVVGGVMAFFASSDE